MFQKMAVARPNLAVSMRFLHMLPLKRSKTSRKSHFCGKVAVSQKTEGGPLDPPSVYDVVQNTSVFEGLITLGGNIGKVGQQTNQRDIYLSACD